jgi:hypothetical protein
MFIAMRTALGPAAFDEVNGIHPTTSVEVRFSSSQRPMAIDESDRDGVWNFESA